MDQKNIYLNLRRLAKEKGMIIADVEHQVGVGTGYFSRLNRYPTKSVPVTAAIKLCEIFDVTLEELLNPPPVETNQERFEKVFGFNPLKAIKEDINLNNPPIEHIWTWFSEPYIGGNND